MAVIEFSAGLMSGLPQRVIFPTTTLSYPGTFFNNGTGYSYTPLLPYDFGDQFTGLYRINSAINIYQGTVPVDFTSLPLSTSRSADILINFNNYQTTTFNSTINVSVNPAIINSGFVAASASGTATWFRIMAATVATSNPANSIIHQIIGTVGATGSGADLELPSTSIVSGQNYRIQNLRIQFPSSWTYT